MLREDRIEEMVIKEMKKLICPSPEIVDWIVEAISYQHSRLVEDTNKISEHLQGEIRRISRMDDNLYDDKLSGLITNERYKVKHEQLMSEKASFEEQLSTIGDTLEDRLAQRMSILKLSQKASEIYQNKTSEQKRFIISKLFEKLTLKSGTISVKYTKFVMVLSQKVQETHKLMEV